MTSRAGGDVPAIVTVFLFLLFAVPARFVVPGFGAAGSPASLVGLVMLGLVVLTALHGESNRFQTSPIVHGMFAYLAVTVAGYANAHVRALSTLAISTSDRAMITIFSLAGLTIFVACRVRTAATVNRIVDLTIAFSMIMCGFGLVQFFFGVDLAATLSIPGLVANTPGIEEVQQRSIFNRPFGTALHPIEFGVVTGALVPLAVARAATDRSTWLRISVLVLAFCAMISISRSAVLALGIMFAVLLLGFGWRQRANLAIGAVVFVIVAGSLVPGLVGTLRSLFANADSDPSVQSRLARTPEVLRLVSENRWFGRGYGTFTPTEYLLLDNEIQKLAIEIGVVGLAVFALWIVAMVWTAVRIAQDAPEHRILAFGLLASVLATLVSSYTFDAFFYHILSGVLYVNLGLLGVLWHLRGDAPSRSGGPRAGLRTSSARGLADRDDARGGSAGASRSPGWSRDRPARSSVDGRGGSPGGTGSPRRPGRPGSAPPRPDPSWDGWAERVRREMRSTPSGPSPGRAGEPGADRG